VPKDVRKSTSPKHRTNLPLNFFEVKSPREVSRFDHGNTQHLAVPQAHHIKSTRQVQSQWCGVVVVHACQVTTIPRLSIMTVDRTVSLGMHLQLPDFPSTLFWVISRGTRWGPESCFFARKPCHLIELSQSSFHLGQP
jgi:hypothetical protein